MRFITTLSALAAAAVLVLPAAATASPAPRGFPLFSDQSGRACTPGQPSFTETWAITREIVHPVDLVHGDLILTATTCQIAEVSTTLTLQFKSTRIYDPGHWVDLGTDTRTITLPSAGQQFTLAVTAACDALTRGDHQWRLHQTGEGTFPNGQPTSVDVYFPLSGDGVHRSCRTYENCPPNYSPKSTFRMLPGLAQGVAGNPPHLRVIVVGKLRAIAGDCPPLQGEVTITVQHKPGRSWESMAETTLNLNGIKPGEHRTASTTAACLTGTWRVRYQARGIGFNGRPFTTGIAFYPNKFGSHIKCRTADRHHRWSAA